MEPGFISFFNSYDIYHITAEEYERLNQEEQHASSNRRFFLYRDQHFTYCRQAFSPLISAISSYTADDSGTRSPWFRGHNKSLNTVLAYISREYQRILSSGVARICSREHTESIVIKIVVFKYWDELQTAIAVVKPTITDAPELQEAMAALSLSSESWSYNDNDTPKSKADVLFAAEYMSDKPLNTKKYKKRSIPLALKRNVWNRYIGEDIGKALCCCCKLTYITQMSFSAGHIVAESKGGQLRLDNLRPLCNSCNSSMGTRNMDEFIREYGL